MSNPSQRPLQARARLRVEELEARNLLSAAPDFAIHYDHFQQDHIIVHWDNDSPQQTTEATALKALGNNTYDVYLRAGVSVAQAVADYSALSGVSYAQPDYQISISGVPSDPSYNSQWDMNQIDAPAAWNVTTRH